MNRRCSDIILKICLILIGVAASRPTNADDLSPSARIHPGGVGRYTPGHWGLVGGIYSNPHPDKAQELTTIVMPPNGAGLQYGRRMVLPAGVTFESEWPIFVPKGPGGNSNFDYLNFQAGKEDQVVQEELGEHLIQNFGTSLGSGTVPWAATLDSELHSEETMHNLRRFSQILRYQERREEGLLSFQLDLMSDQPEIFEPLEYLSISHEGLVNRPAVMDALRLWVQRGGRLVVAVDLAGTDVWNGLFGSTAPLTLVQEASSVDVRLQLNPNYSTTRYPTPVVEKHYEEPVRHFRVIAENVEPIWSVDEWPVVIRLPFGKGEVIGLLIESRALIEGIPDTGQGIPWKLLDSGGSRIAEILYKIPEPDLISPNALLVQANHQIGYSIPSVMFPLIIAFGFPVILVAIGIWLYRRSCPERLIAFAPVLAIVIAIPPLIAGIRQRSVAPVTVAEYRTVRAIPGQPGLVSDGMSVLYSPDSAPTLVTSNSRTQHNPPTQKGRRETRRQITSPSGDRTWSNIAFPSGLTAIPFTSSTTLTQPLSARLSFDADGIVGTVESGPFQNPADLVLAGSSPERMSLNLQDNGIVRGGIDKSLGKDTFVRGTLISNEQRQREQTYRDIFNSRGRPAAFPESSTLLYWAHHARDDHDKNGIGDPQTAFTGTTLVAQTVEWVPPESGMLITIPAAAIQYRGIASKNGKFSSTYSNQNREWVAREIPTDFIVEFQIPLACTPFDPETVRCSIRIRAPARKVVLSCGTSPSDLTEFHTVIGPVGMLDVELPLDAVRSSLKTGRFVMQFAIGELNLNADEESESSGEQDDSWIIDRLNVNLTGQRTAGGEL